MNESRSDGRCFKKDRSKKFDFNKKLELIEGRNLASIWKCFDQHYIGESMEMFNMVLQFPLFLNGTLNKTLPDRCQVATFN